MSKTSAAINRGQAMNPIETAAAAMVMSSTSATDARMATPLLTPTVSNTSEAAISSAGATQPAPPIVGQ